MDHSDNPTSSHPHSCETTSSACPGDRTSHIQRLLSLCHQSLLLMPLNYRLSYDSHDLECALRDEKTTTTSSLQLTVTLLWALWLNSLVPLHLPCLPTEGPTRKNQSALCFHLCRKPEQSRMPSSSERHSCLAMCKEDRDKWHGSCRSVIHGQFVTSVLIQCHLAP